MAGEQPIEKTADTAGLPGTFPETPAAAPTSEPTFSVNPIPASAGTSNPITLNPGEKPPPVNPADLTSGVHDDPELKAKDEAKDQVVGISPLPATGGASNPIHLEPGQKVPPASDITSNTTTSNVTLDKESYENASGSVPVSAPVTENGKANGGVFSVPPITGNLIPESSLPIGNGAPGPVKDVGATIQSAAPTSTTAALAGQVPLESAAVPEVVTESQKAAHVEPEASAVPEAVAEKKEVEQELLEKVTAAPVTAGATIEDKATAAVGIAGGALAALGAAAATTAVLAKDKAVEASKQLPEPVQKGINQITSAVGVTPQSTTAALAGAVPKETPEPIQKGINQLTSAVGVTPTSTTAGLAGGVPKEAPGVPEVVKDSIAAANTSPEAASNAEAVVEKKAVESELLAEVKPVNAAGEPAPAVTAALSATAPGAEPTKLSAPAAADLSDVSPLTKPTEPTTAVPSVTADAAKPEAAPAAAGASTEPEARANNDSAEVKENKKKNRRSIYKKIKGWLKEHH